ncbi:response regulator [Geomonas sp.]|uniref:response regulator n=1 Tax=Geomonas sp. TaxID=2651584 RepID=UPI002B49CFE7|nr:response regulator [Geomonas sp.]HJV33463.1 response regulator [Geomonas sp.]
MTPHMQAGEALVRAGIISASALEKALARQKESGKGLGAVLAELGVLKEEHWIEAISKAFCLKTVSNITAYNFPPELLALIPAEFAAERLVFPLKEKDGMLAVAISDPFDTDTLEILAGKTSLKIVPFLARRADIEGAIEAKYPESTGAPAGPKVLVVDDSQAIASIIRGVLQKEGYRVSVGHDGLEGLKLAVAEKPDLIITDTVMPRLDGFGLLRALKGNPDTARIPLILLTAKSGAEEEQRALEAGFLDFLPKPVQPTRVVSRVKQALEKAPESPQR